MKPLPQPLRAPLVLGGLLLASLYAPSAWAQAYLVAETPDAYAPIAPDAGTTLTRSGDAEMFAVDLPFDFRFFNRSYTRVWVSVNGAVTFLGVDPASGVLLPVPDQNVILPSVSTPQAMLAPAWDDWVARPDARGGGSRIAVDTRTVEDDEGTHRTLVIDWQRLQRYGDEGANAASYSFQLLLHEGSHEYELRFGPVVRAATGHSSRALDATTGAENHLGTVGVSHKSCNPNCASNAFFPSPSLLVSPNLDAELVLSLSKVGVHDGGPVIEVLCENQGLSAAEDLTFDLYLSRTPAFDPTATPVHSAPETFELGARPAERRFEVPIPLPPGAKGPFYVVGRLDGANESVPELNKANNKAALVQPFIAGVELSVEMFGQTAADAGGRSTYNVRVRNAGVASANGVVFHIELAGGTLRAPVRLYESAPVDVGPEQATLVNVSVTMPNDLPPGGYYVRTKVDPNGAFDEWDETNNASERIDIELRGADIAVSEVATGLATGHLGQAIPVQFRLSNLGTAEARDFLYAVYLSKDNDVITRQDTRVYLSAPVTLAPRESRVVTHLVPIPETLETGLYFAGVIADAAGKVRETDLSNNVAPARTPIIVAPRAADIVAASVAAQPRARAGAMVRVSALLANVGNEPATFGYSVHLSDNELVSTSDPLIGSGTVTLSPSKQRAVSFDARVPPTLRPGRYHVTLIADPAGEIIDANRENNRTLSTEPVEIGPAALRILNASLPDALVESPYDVLLGAAGGAETPAWQLVGGALPDGLTLDATGRLAGVPTEEGVFALVVEAKSAELRAFASFTLSVRRYAASLGLLDPVLPAGRRGVEYQERIGTVGGTGRATFSRRSGALPAGIALAEDGTVSGYPTEAGEFPFEVEIRDEAGERLVAQVSLTIRSEGALSLLATRLREGEVSRPYSAVLPIEGGKAPYTVSVAEGRLPTGLTLALDPSGVALSLAGAPSERGVHAFTLVVTDAQGERAMEHLVLEVVQRRLSFITTDLPHATRGAPYRAILEANARAPFTFSLAGGALPQGLVLDESGLLTGAVPLQAPARLHAFAVRVRDAQGGEALSAFSIDVPAPPRATDEGGCASTGATLWALLVPLALLLRRKSIAALTALVVLTIASPASAYYRLDTRPERYAPLPDDEQTTTHFDTTAAAFDQSSTSTRGLALPIPFAFKFYGAEQTIAGITTKGLLTFGAVSLTWSRDEATPLPAAGGPSQFIAPMWGYMNLSKETPTTPSTIRSRVEGEAPNRVLAIEWHNLQHAGWSPPYKGESWAAYSFQVRLHEGTNAVSIHYGGDAVLLGRTPPLAFAMGVEGLDGAEGIDISDTRCSPACTAANFPLDAVFTLEVVPDLSIEHLDAPDTLFEGAQTPLRTVVRNSGDNDARRAKVRFYLSNDQFIDEGDVVLGDSTPVTIVATARATINTRVAVPEGVEPGLYFLLARVDPDGEIIELDESNNDATPKPVVVLGRAPDFVPVRLLGPSAIDAGAPFSITRTIRNEGSASGSGFFKVVLSANEQASMADLVLDEGDFTLAPGELVDATRELTVPSTVTPGTYHLALLVRPADGVVETDALNNDRLLGPVLVRGGGLALSDAPLPTVAAGVGFSLQLTATGGAGGYRFLMGEPAAPAGVTLSSAGVLKGRVEATGEWPVQVRVESGGARVSRTYRLRATGVASPLRVVTERTAIARLGAPYEAHLLAQGGTPPYAWSLEGTSALPAGLLLASDGVIEGVPLVDGESLASVQVTDAAGTTARQTVALPVAGPTRPLFANTVLEPATVGVPYDARVEAAGGKAPYRYSVVDTRRIASSNFDENRYFVGELPPGLVLEQGGHVSGTPSLAGTYVVTLRLVDARSSDATSQFALVVRSPGTLAIQTGALPVAVIGESLNVELKAAGAVGDVRWEVASFDTRPALPAGVLLLSDGRLAGTPLEAGVTNFVVIARDASGQMATQPLALRVVHPPVEREEGCAQAGTSGLVALGVALVFLVRRRGLLALALGIALATGACQDPRQTCVETCAAPFVCDDNDGLCKCGGTGGAVCAESELCDAPTRTCLAPTCETGCPAPLVCGEDGACRCGTPSGPVCAKDEVCSAFGRCERVSRCEGVLCAGGMRCDEGSGSCVCGDDALSCSSTERCVDAACVPDRCLGVACSGGTSCDATDGLCKCGGEGGAVCTGGETCNPLLAACVRSSRCDGVECASGSSCDPADGLCKCGGPTGPVCGDAQSCDPLERKCLGGDQCVDVTCEGGTSCDPEDGLCKCGGHGGAVCRENAVCVVQGAQARCETTCSVLENVCGEGLGCVWNSEASLAWCAPVGQVSEGRTCGDNVGTCAAGLHCAPTGRVCRPYCLVSKGCGDDAVCFPFEPGVETGSCVPFTSP